ncbi:sugar phosphate isomerase/epimerase [Actinoplanes sp. NBC_00393]|uniref:TIM barrel protein n=1 Tax=Actinoplanes sp. NBC_00393 TaxID=2975953 RepID=UPI002E2092A5
MYQLSPNVELLFTEAGPDIADRIRAAAAAGFDAVEMWGTLDRDVTAIGRALGDTGVALTSMIAEPRTNFTLPGTDLKPFFDGLDRGIENARTLGSPRIVLGSGIGFPGAKRPQNLERLVEVFREAVTRTEGSGVKLVLEPVNTRVDHPGALLDRTAEAVAVARAVDSERFGILYDLYHSVTESEDPATVLADAGDLVDYVQIADAPGRGEPGSGSLDWAAQLRVLREAGYRGPIGLEYMPTVDTVTSLRHIRSFERLA